MSHSFIDRSSNYFTQNYDNEETQKKIDPIAQLKEINNTTVREWGLFNNPSVQMYPIDSDTESKILSESAQQDDNPLSSNNQDFFTNVKTYIDEQVKIYNDKISDLEAEYKKKNWAIDKTKGNFKNYLDRITLLDGYKEKIESIETEAKSKGAHGDDLLTLMNIVHNEAANYGDKAKLAVAYAYLNRIKYMGDGNIREPENDQEISHYSELNDRWKGFTTTAEKLEFLKNIKDSFDAAKTRFDADGKTDPTKGATHWVSPIGLESASGSDDKKSGYYPRNYPGVGWKFFPNWARSNDWVKENPKEAGKWFNVSEYEEITAAGVDGKEFLFYKGVKY